MKLKKTIIIIVLVLLFICMGGVSGYIYGVKQSDNMVIDNSVIQERILDNSEVKNDTYDSTKVAVVNMDEGTTVNNEKIYYAEKMIQFPNTSFSYTSLSDAQTGLDNDIYGAYIIIPASFSENVVSLNTTPTASEIHYNINEKASGSTQYTLLYNIVSFGNQLNSNLSYMYLSNILSEFHRAQDNAQVVIKNDKADFDAIMNINAVDLITLVSIPELIKEENDTEALDISANIDTNEKISNSIEEKYLQYVEDIKLQLETFKDNGKSLSDMLNTLSTEATEMNILNDLEGNNVKQSVEAVLENALIGESENVIMNNEWITTQLSDIKTDVDTSTNELSAAIELINNGTQQSLADNLSGYKKNIEDALPEIHIYINDLEKSCSITFDDDDNAPCIVFSILNNDGEVEKIDNNIELVRLISAVIVNKIESVSIETDEKDISFDSTNGENDIYEIEEINTEEIDIGENDILEDKEQEESDILKNNIEYLIKECNRDEEISKLLDLLQYDSTVDFLKDISENRVDFEAEQKIEMFGDEGDFNTYIINKINGVDTSDYVIPEVTLSENLDSLSGVSKSIDDMQENAKNLNILNTDLIKGIFLDDYVGTLETNAKNFTDVYLERYNSEKNEINVYNELLNSYKPSYDFGFVSESISSMIENNNLIANAVFDNNMSYQEYAEKVYNATNENITLLEQAIFDGNGEANKKIENELGSAQNIKMNNSEENQKLLADFISKLSYTRLGSVEYTQSYEFIVDPVTFMADFVPKPMSSENKTNISDNTMADNSKDMLDNAGIKSQNKTIGWIYYLIAGLIITAVCIVLLMVYYKISTKDKGKGNKNSWQ